MYFLLSRGLWKPSNILRDLDVLGFWSFLYSQDLGFSPISFLMGFTVLSGLKL